MSPDYATVVIGSGPAGIAAAKALLATGEAVTLLDVGREMPVAARNRRDSLASKLPHDWNRTELEKLNQASLRQRDGVPLKTVFGSDFAYHFNPEVADNGALILGSHARGGLSNAWGASILPLSERDLQNWPISQHDLAPHYAAVLTWLPHMQDSDALSTDYPLYGEPVGHLKLSRQGERLLQALSASRDTLARDGIRFGRSRLAISNCHYCGQCLHGCPYDFIYSTNSTLADLLGTPGFQYRSNTEVVALEETDDHVVIRLRDGQSVTAGRVYLGAGVLNTALLIMPLLRLRQLTIRDSAYGLVPFMSYSNTPGVQDEALFTLPQVFMEVDVDAVSPRNAHLQWYGYNNFYREELRRTLGFVDRLLPERLARMITGRLWSIQSFLHSDDSPSIELSLDENGGATLTPDSNPQTDRVLGAVYRKLRAASATLGGRILPALGRPGQPGGSFHSGASLPMSKHPVKHQSDLAGRPGGLRRVHIVDSSVFPDIASSTITLSVMANAHRIASNHRQYG